MVKVFTPRMAAAPRPGPSPAAGGPLGRWLTHPATSTTTLRRALARVAVADAPWLTVAGAVLVAGAVAVLGVRWWHRRRLEAGGRQVEVQTPPEVDPASATAFWTHLVALLRPAWKRALGAQPHIGFTYSATAGGGMTITVWVPAVVPPGLVERAAEAAWPGARTSTREAEPPLPQTHTAITGGRLRLGRAECFPLRTDHGTDPLRPLLGALAGLEEGEAACVQILARPATGRRLRGLHRAAGRRRGGQPLSRSARLLDLVTPGTGRRPLETDPERAGEVTAILAKAAEPCWAVSVRYAVTTTATDPHAAARLRGRAHALASAFALYAGRNMLLRKPLQHPATALARRRLPRRTNLLGVSELAALAHLPTDPAVPGLVRAGAKAVAPSPLIPAEGKVLGDSDTGPQQASGRGRPVALLAADARQHLHVMGATGSGKSTLLTNLILGDVQAGRGVVVIDPKGDLVTDLLDRLPKNAGSRTVLIDPDESACPPALTVLDPTDHHLSVDNLVGIFRNVFASSWGPRTDDVLRSACLTLLHHAAPQPGSSRADGQQPGASLADIPQLLSDPIFRAQATAGLDDPAGLGGFWTWYEGIGDAGRAQAVGPVLNKLRAFLLRDFIRTLVGRGQGSFNMGDVLNGGICLARVPKGVLGEDTARLVGSFVVAQVWQAATHRARLSQHARVDAALYVDECQNFMTLPRSFDEMLAEARGYRLSLVLAHQHLAQLPRDLKDAVSANARTKVWFTTSPEDAHALARHVTPELTEHDLSHLPVHTAAARLVVDGAEMPACTVHTRPAPPAVPARAQQVRAAAAFAFGRKAATVRAAPVESPQGGDIPDVAPPRGSEVAPQGGSQVALTRDPHGQLQHPGSAGNGPSRIPSPDHPDFMEGSLA